MSLQPVKKSNISDTIFGQLKQQIISGQWKPGDKIPSENELKTLFCVSRISIREALQKLVTLGLAETRHGEGTFVRELGGDIQFNALIPMLVLDQPDIMKTLEFRKIIEVESAYLAAQRATPESAGVLENIYNRMKSDRADYKKHAFDDFSFHLQIAKMTENPIIVKVHFILKDMLSAYMEDIVATLGDTKGLYYHEKLLDAIKNKQPDLARSYMREHIDSTITGMNEAKKTTAV